MPVERGENTGRGEEATHFARSLSTLKQRGNALLVVGAVPEEMYRRASRQMLGDEHAATPRRRLVVYPGDNPDQTAERFRGTGPLAPEFARLVANGESARSVAADAPTTNPTPSADAAAPKAHHVDGSLGQLGRTVTDVISQFDVAAGGLGPAELRVAFDCLPTLLSHHDEETVFRFLHLLTSQVRFADGMGHVHLPRPLDDVTVQTFAPLFDAVIELAVDGGVLKQRWHFRDDGFVSEWLTVEE